MADTDRIIRKYALQNAVNYKGKAQPGNVIGKVFGEDPKLKTKAKEISRKVMEAVKEVNRLSPEEQAEELKKIAPELLEKKKEKRGLAELPNAKTGKVVTRIPPEPSKYSHIGHALSFLLNYLYAKKYNGRCILRFEDTNPDTSRQEYVDAMKEDVLDYLGIEVDKVIFVSDDLKTFYRYAEELISKDKAYVCFCERTTMKEYRQEGMECLCRKKPKEKNLEEWESMLAGKYREGECVLRLKGEMGSDNYAMRDPVMMRINCKTHYRQKDKYRVWPMYDFENAIEDSMCGITHILRDINFGRMRVELQDYIKGLLGLKISETVQYGRFNVVGTETKGREIRRMIEEKMVTGWDDPRLVTLRALKRRGFAREMFYELAIEVGLSPTPTNIEWSLISSINRKVLDPKARRYFFIREPKEIFIADAPKQDIELDLHPDKTEGGRRFRTYRKFYITEDDYRALKDKNIYRLMDCLNFTKDGQTFLFKSADYSEYREKGKMIMHWLPVSEELAKVEVMMPDTSTVEGLAEPGVKKLKTGDVVQFERFGFVRVDRKKKDRLVLRYTHE